MLGRTAKVGRDAHEHKALWQVMRLSIEDEAPIAQNLLNRRLHRRQVPIQLWQDEDVRQLPGGPVREEGSQNS